MSIRSVTFIRIAEGKQVSLLFHSTMEIYLLEGKKSLTACRARETYNISFNV